MSPVSKKRKKRKSGRPRPASPAACQCAACTGQLVPDLTKLAEVILRDAFDLPEVEDPLDAEIAAALVVGLGVHAPDEFEEDLATVLVPAFESAATPGAMALLLALESVAPSRGSAAARAAADRLTAPDLLRGQGVPVPSWATALREPWTVSDVCRLSEPEQPVSVLAAVFSRAGRSHGVAVVVDDEDCGAAADILLTSAEELPEALAELETSARADGVEFARQEISARAFRWWAEQALDARAVHDQDEDEPPPPDENDNRISYGALAALLRAQLRTLPSAKAPPGAVRGPHADPAPEDLAEQIGALIGGARPQLEKPLPPRRGPASGPGPIYQLKVVLRGTTPPIWRRLEVPASLTLADLHAVLQTAFGWSHSHLHEFDTALGRFADHREDADFDDHDLRPEDAVTLEQVAPKVGDKLQYIYDFGDDWQHDIAVEKVLERGPGIDYPRCTGGRRAAPPEDCGGVWGYQDLIDVLANPDDEEHEDRLEWLGLADRSDFDPDAFDAAEVNHALRGLKVCES